MNGKKSKRSVDPRTGDAASEWLHAGDGATGEVFNVLKPDERFRGSKKDLGTDIITLNRVAVADLKLERLEQRVKASEAKYRTLRDETSTTKKQVEEQAGRLRRSTADLAKMDSQVKNDKLQAIQILALFVAFFTFVSVEFQLFNNVKSPGALVALSMMLLGALTIFVGVTYLGLAYYAAKAPTGTANEGEDTNTDEDEPALRFNKEFLWGITSVAFIFLAFGVGLNVWLARNDLYATRDKTVACEQLSGDIVKELEKSDSKVADFLKLRYETECQVSPKPAKD